MTITDTRFGTIIIDGETYQHDVIIRLSGEVVKRKKKLSKRIYGSSHTISEDEVRYVFEKGCKQLVIGTGQSGLVALSSNAEAYLEDENCAFTAQPTPQAIQTFNAAGKDTIGLFHITC